MTNWLPEDYTLTLTAFDVGALTGMLSRLEDGQDGEINEPDENGEPVPTTFKKRFLKKLEKIADGFYDGRTG